MSQIDEGMPGRSKFWIWFLVFVLLVLLLVPVLSIGLALKKTGWTPVTASRRWGSKTASGILRVRPPKNDADDVMSALRAKIENIAARVIKAPVLHSKMQQVQIQASSEPSISKAEEAVHAVLRDRKHQFVEAISPDSIRIVVIIPSNEWPELSGSLQNAAEKDGFVYRGPNQTSTSGSGADSHGGRD